MAEIQLEEALAAARSWKGRKDVGDDFSYVIAVAIKLAEEVESRRK